MLLTYSISVNDAAAKTGKKCEQAQASQGTPPTLTHGVDDKDSGRDDNGSAIVARRERGLQGCASAQASLSHGPEGFPQPCATLEVEVEDMDEVDGDRDGVVDWLPCRQLCATAVRQLKESPPPQR